MPIVFDIGTMSKDLKKIKLITTYHTVENTFGGEIHAGKRKGCPVCKKALERQRKERARENRSKPLTPRQHSWPECKECGCKVRPDNTTGLCIICLTKARAKQKVANAPKCAECGTRLNKKTRTGMCVKCYNKSRKKHAKEEATTDKPRYMSVSFI